MPAPLRTTSASLLLLLGAAHVAFTFVEHRRLSAAAIWFAGAGMALMFLAALNLMPVHSSPTLTILRLANLAGVIYGGFAAAAVPVPQAYLGCVLMVLLLASSFSRRDRRPVE